MTPEETKTIKLAWANGETVQYFDGSSWWDWPHDDCLDLLRYDRWRVKPKPITVYVWATIYPNGTVMTQSRPTKLEAVRTHNELQLSGNKCTPIVCVELERLE